MNWVWIELGEKFHVLVVWFGLGWVRNQVMVSEVAMYYDGLSWVK